MKFAKKINKEQEDRKMKMAFIGKIADMIKGVADLSKSVVESTDPEKYANAVEKLNQGVSDTYEQMRTIIVNSNKLTEEEKLEKLEALAKQEFESKAKCDEAIKGNREHVANIAMEIIKGLLTCGVSFAPEIAKRLKLVAHNDINIDE